MKTVFIGYDKTEIVAYHVCAHSILSRASEPVAIIPLNLANMPWFNRPRENQSTDFSFSRFLTPFLSNYAGKSLFLDADMLVRCDIVELFDQCLGDKDVWCVQHDYTPKDSEKFLGNKQVPYLKKNWSSVMVFNNAKCDALTPRAVETKSAKWLHQFQWTTDDRIGKLDPVFNHLVGEYDPEPNAKIVHYTLGTPCFKGYERQEYAPEWFAEYEVMTSCVD